MRVIGFDPGYGRLGFSVVDSERGMWRLVSYGTIVTHKDDIFSDRLKYIGEQILVLINKFKPDEVSIEELYFQKNAKTAIKVAEARGVILYVCAQQNLPIFEYTPLQVKQSLTGYGKAEKQQIQEMVKLLLKLDRIPKPDDAADAIAIALTHIQNNRLLR
ncbi:MAG TPA: crossover junction endodeoxyribonuclease RuvC [Clostridia bacterium]|jgi:crossover junction endodeoxyribonuclease RuvC|nr:crossover junction endodeoxyribonuclease RuvC [Clostridia bacterium]